MPTEAELIELIKRELPRILKGHPDLRDYVLRVTREAYADRAETESRFDRVLDELRRDREAQARKWDEQARKWDEQVRKWDEQARQWHEVHEEIMRVDNRIDSTVGAIGARWGVMTEEAFRNGLRAILEKSFDVKVLHVTEYDQQGEVFGRPDQVELDLIVQDSVLIICEIKSSASKSDMYSFERKARYYERTHRRKADRLMVISPMIDPKARGVAEGLGVECYSSAYDVPPLAAT